MSYSFLVIESLELNLELLIHSEKRNNIYFSLKISNC